MSTNGFSIHPAADLFPMMTADELQELATDIETNGLRFPIMMDADGKVLIDGRNRLEACKLAKVEPRFAKLPDGSDPLAFIASVNLMRRNLTKGQQAMAMAMMYPEPAKHQRGAKKPSELEGIHEGRLSQARAVLRHSRSLAESVLKGITPLDAALAKVRQEQQFQQSDEAKLARLQKAAPDLAEQVNEERLKINEAIAALQVREQELARICEDGRRAAQDIVGQFAGNVTAIVQAIDSGEGITMPERQIGQLQKFYTLLLARIPNPAK
jgi:ParB/Sulfiredoxin domain